MPDRNNTTALIVLAGVGAGLLTGFAFALLASACRKKDPKPLGETVEELRARADHVLDELSEGIDALMSRSREAEPQTVA